MKVLLLSMLFDSPLLAPRKVLLPPLRLNFPASNPTKTLPAPSLFVVPEKYPKNELKSGMIAGLALDGIRLPQTVFAVPLSAVIRDPQTTDGFAVMVAGGDSEVQSVHARSVQLGSVYGNMIGITGGLQSGERVVTTGVTLLKNGGSVRIIP